MSKKHFTAVFITLLRQVKIGGLHPSLFCILHPLALFLTGYSIVTWPVPLLLKTGLFALVVCAGGWIAYRALMRTRCE